MSKSWPGSRLAVQIALVIFLVVAVSGFVSYIRVSATVGDRTERRFSAIVERGAAQIASQLEQSTRLALADVSLLGSGVSFVDRTDAGDALAAVRLAIPERTIGEAGTPSDLGLTIYDANGRLLLRAHQPGDQHEGPLPEDVRGALGGKPTVTIRVDATFGLSFASAAPLVAPDGRIAGAVETLTRIDATYIERLAALSGLDVAVVTDAGPTVSHELAGIALSTPQDTDPAARQTPTHLAFGKEPYLAMVVPLRAGVSGEVGRIYAGVRLSTIAADQQDARSQVLTGTSIALAVGAGLALGFGVLLTRPVWALAASARRIQRNDLHSPIPRSGPREMRDLADALDEMRVAIQETREDLIGHNEQLARRAEASDAGLSQATVELSVMHNIIEELTVAPQAAPDVAATQLLRLDWVDGAAVALAGTDGRLHLSASHGLTPPAVDLLLRALDDRITEPMLNAGVFVQDTRTDRALGPLSEHGIGAIAVVPMSGPRGTTGVLAVSATRPIGYPESQRSLLRAAANDLGSSLQRFALASEAEESRRLAESVLREMTDGLMVLDAEGRCQVCNAAAARLLGINAMEVLDRPATEWMPFPAATIERVLQPRRADGDTQPATEPATIAEHAGRLLALNVGPLHAAGAAQGGHILQVRDVTDIFAAERAKQDFILMIGHDLRTPLTLIRTSVDLLREEGAGTLNPTQQRITEVLRNNSDRLLHLIGDLLDLSALESGVMRAHPERTSLSSLVDEVVMARTGDAGTRGLAIAAEHSAGDVHAWADPNRIRQVLTNLVDNALKYTPTGGQVTIRVVPGEPFVRIDVSDTGIGISPEEQQRLFTKFYRTSTGRRHASGTGLGLAIAASIVELHGGKIWCESDGKSGTTFSFTLPSRITGGDPLPQAVAGPVSTSGR